MANLNTNTEIQKIDQILSHAKCHALGLNEHFPRAVLHGPMDQGGMEIHTGQSKTTTSQVNYFMYHCHRQTKVGAKLEASMAYLQLEIGIHEQFFSSSFDIYGPQATKSLIKRYGKRQNHTA